MVNNKGDEIRYISNLVSMLANKPILSSIPRI
jgi:hypothetical protein